MKKTKRILIIALAIVLMCSLIAVIAIATGAAEQRAAAPKLKIVATNLSFSDSVYIKYAVDRVNVDDDNQIKMLIWTSASSEYTYGTQNVVLDPVGSQNIGGVEYVIFDYTDLAARQMTDDVYARAYVEVGGTAHYSEVSKYSILKYAYNKLGKTGTATTNEKLIDLLENMLNYGALAQTYTNYRTDRLATDNFVQIKIEGGVLSDGFDNGLFKEGETATITAPATNDGFTFAGWKNSEGVIVSANATATVTAGASNELYSAVYQGTYTQGLEYTLSADEKSYYVSSMGKCTDVNVVIPAVHNGKLVTGIAAGAFQGEANIKSITMTGYICQIGDNAFEGCTSLSAIYFGGTNSEWKNVVKGAAWDSNTGSYTVYVSGTDDDWGIGGVPISD